MRRREKYITIGAGLGIAGSILYDVWQQRKTKNAQGGSLTWDNYDFNQTAKLAIRNGLIGGLAGFCYYKYRIYQESGIPFDADNYLKTVLKRERLDNDPEYLQKAIEYRDAIKKKLFEHFKDLLVTYPLNGGSFVKRTAIHSGYDLDIVLAFSRSSYSSLEEMYLCVYYYIDRIFGAKATVKKETKAISMSFELASGDCIEFDIAPGREINDFRRDSDLNFFVRQGYFSNKPVSFKTNYNKQRHTTTNKPHARDVIKLIKVYCNRNNLDIPTIIIEKCVVEALSNIFFGIDTSLSENFLNAMEYLSQKLMQSSILDPTNSNNNLVNKLGYFTRCSISNLIDTDIHRIENNPRYLMEAFDYYS